MNDWIYISLAAILAVFLVYGLILFVRLLNEPWDEWDTDDDPDRKE